jgi:hypothetical protein
MPSSLNVRSTFEGLPFDPQKGPLFIIGGPFLLRLQIVVRDFLRRPVDCEGEVAGYLSRHCRAAACGRA